MSTGHCFSSLGRGRGGQRGLCKVTTRYCLAPTPALTCHPSTGGDVGCNSIPSPGGAGVGSVGLCDVIPRYSPAPIPALSCHSSP